jgi:type IV secretory pathway VirB10-like protein
MASNSRVFFAGMGTTFIILAVGFGGGVILARTTMELPAPSPSLAARLPPARVILPASAEAAAQPQPLVETPAAPDPPPPVTPVKQVQQAQERDRQAERAEQRKAEAKERARRKRYAERKARLEAARLAAEQPGVMAFGSDDYQRRGGGFFFPSN